MANICTNILVIRPLNGSQAALAQFKKVSSELIAQADDPNPYGSGGTGFFGTHVPEAAWGCTGEADAYLLEYQPEGLVKFDVQTRWNPPVSWTEKLSIRFPLIAIDMGWSEPGNGFTGRLYCAEGETKHLREGGPYDYPDLYQDCGDGFNEDEGDESSGAIGTEEDGGSASFFTIVPTVPGVDPELVIQATSEIEALAHLLVEELECPKEECMRFLREYLSTGQASLKDMGVAWDRPWTWDLKVTPAQKNHKVATATAASKRMAVEALVEAI